jgi:hypothetical protein
MAGVIVAYSYGGSIPGITFDIHKSIEFCQRLGLTVYLETDINQEWNCNKFNYESSIFSSYEKIVFIYTGHGENGNFDIRGKFLNMNDYITNICRNNQSTEFLFIIDCCNVKINKPLENAIIITSTNLTSITKSGMVGSKFIKLIHECFGKYECRQISELRKEIKAIAPDGDIITTREELYGWTVPGNFDIDIVNSRVIIRNRSTGELFTLDY